MKGNQLRFVLLCPGLYFDGSTAPAGTPRHRGLDLTINRHLAIRAVQADYLRTELPNGQGNQQNLLLAGAGIVLRVW
jgi:hypothetical protein